MGCIADVSRVLVALVASFHTLKRLNSDIGAKFLSAYSWQSRCVNTEKNYTTERLQLIRKVLRKFCFASEHILYDYRLGG